MINGKGGAQILTCLSSPPALTLFLQRGCNPVDFLASG